MMMKMFHHQQLSNKLVLETFLPKLTSTTANIDERATGIISAVSYRDSQLLLFPPVSAVRIPGAL